MTKQRIELLDSFRFIAILSVLLFHFANLSVTQYPYGDFLFHIFKYGYPGVQFFFIISGFVISYTLENTPTLLSFWRNRFSRLFPPMLLCSVITFITICLLDDQYLFKNAHEIKNFIPSLTFTNPTLWTLATKINFSWLSSSYWSLWVEIQFYLIASGVYFLSPKHFFRNMLLVGVAISVIKYIPIYLLNSHVEYIISHGLHTFLNGWRYGNEIFYITFYITWFLPGVIFYHLYKGFNIKQNIFSILCSVVALFFLVWDTRIFFAKSFNILMPACLLMFTLFLLMIYRKKYLFFLKNSLFSRIGIISYSIYLIHEEVGNLLINKYGKYLGSWGALSLFIMIILVVCFAELSYRFYERKIGLILKHIFDKETIPKLKTKLS